MTEVAARKDAVKICGVNTPAAFDAAVEAGADWIGFVFFPASPRYVTADQAAALSARHNGGPRRVGLFVNPTEADIHAVTATLGLAALQLYGPLDVAAMRQRFGLPIWRPVPVSSTIDLPSHDMGADTLLLESKAPAASSRPGGNAVTFNWSVLDGWTSPAPWLLAGGLTPANVAGAIRTAKAEAVDVSSGVETSPGVKDPEWIRAFIHAARHAYEPA